MNVFRIIYMFIFYFAYAISINGAQFLNITFLFELFAAAAVAKVSPTVIIPLTTMYASL